MLEKHSIRSQYLHGGQSSKQRDTVVQSFAQDASCRVLLASTAAANVGLNLTCANHVVIMEPTWNPAVVEQAMNRVYRIGQTRPVTVAQYIARDTVEDKILALSNRKKEIGEFCLSSGNPRSSRLSKSDLLALFAPRTEAP